MSGADLKDYVPQITELSKQIAAARSTRSTAASSATAPRPCCATKLYKPVIAAIDGPCVAGGMEMLGGVDIRVATPARHVRGDGAQARPVRRRRHHRPPAAPDPVPAAMEFLLTAEAFPAERAIELGLLNEIVPPDELMPAASAGPSASSPTARSPSGRRRSPCCAACPAPSATPTRSRTSSPQMVFQSDDAKEGPKAFAEKRDPGWKNR